MNTDEEPDDDLEDENGTCGTDASVANPRFPTEVMADTDGENDHGRMGTLVVYNDRLSDADEMTAIEVMGQITVGGIDVDMGDAVTQSTTDPTTSITLSVELPITYSSESVTVDGDISDGASMVVMMGAEVCARGVCELDYNATPSTATAASTEITVMVTAENGYNDHDYTFSVSRDNPVGNVPDGLAVDDDDDGTVEEVVFSATATVWPLTAVEGTTVEITFDFKTVDYPDDHALAGDAMWCQTATVTDAGEDLTAEPAERGDPCDGMRFDVDMPETVDHERDLTVIIMSEDGEPRTTFIRLTATATGA